MALKVGELFASIKLDSKQYNTGLKSVLKGTKGAVSSINSLIKAAGSLYLAKQAFDLGKAAINYSGQIEQLQVSFETMTGSAAKAKSILGEIRDIAAKTPFEVSGLAETQQLLMNYGFTAETALDRMMMLGDIAQGDEEKLKGIATAYGQMNSAGKVMLQDVKQMIERGFNPLQIISESTGESMASLYDRISKGTIAVEEITAAMVTATSAGGRYFQSMEKQSKTLNGQISTLKDNSMELMGDVFQPMFDSIRTEILPEMNNTLAELQEGYTQGGMDGLADAFSDVSKDMLKGLDESSKKAFKKLEKKIPKYTENAFDVLPDALRAGGTLASGLTETLFDTGTEAITGLIDRIPEWGPPFGEALLKTVSAAVGGALNLLRKSLQSTVGLFVTDAEEIWESLVDQEKVAYFSAQVKGNVDVSEAKTAIQTAYSELTTALNTDLLSESQVAQITDMIGSDYDAIYAKLKSFGLSDTDAAALAGNITAASNAVMKELEGLNIGADAATVTRWIAQAEGSSLRLKSALKRSGLSPEEQAEVVKVFTDMTDNINGKLPDVVSEIYKTLTDGSAANDNKTSLKSLLDEAFKADVQEVDKWLESNIGELDTESANYAAEVAALTQEAQSYKAEITTLQAEMVALVESLAGQPTAVVEARMNEFAAIESRLAEINSYIDSTTAAAENAYAQAYKRVRAGATTDQQDIADALSYAYSKYKVDAQAIEDAATAAKAEADAAWDSGLKDDAARETHLRTLESIAENRETELQSLKTSYAGQLTDLMQGLGEAFSITEPESMKQIEAIADKLNIVGQLNSALETMQIGDDSAVQTAKQRVSEIIEQLTGEEVFPAQMSYGRAESFITGLENSLKEDIAELEITGTEGENPVLTAFETMFESAAFEGMEFDPSTLSEKISTIMNGVGSDAAAGIGTGAAAYDFSGDTGTMAMNLETSARSAFQSNSPARIMIPLGSDVAAGLGLGMSLYDFSSAVSSMVSAVQNFIDASSMSNDLEDDGESAGGMFASGLASGILNGESSIKAAARKVAQAAIDAANAKLKIASPSRVMMESGSFFSEGFAKGILNEMDLAVSASSDMAKMAASAATIRRPADTLAPVKALARSERGRLIDYDELADAMDSRPMYFNVDGKRLASVTGADRRKDNNAYNRSIALGVGRR